MNYLSVCSGIEAATVAWHSLGWKAAGFAEIEKFPSAVLKERFPDVTNYGDMTKFKEWENVGTVDLLVGGTPCQSFSVAGLRKGLADPRGNLMLTFGAIAHHFKARWVVWENVPGVLSSNKGRDFGTFLGMLAELGYGFAYRVLDAQFFGVPQRRRRVFVVGCLGSWLNAAKVLFDSESLSGNPPPRRSKGKEAAGNAGNSSADAVCLMDQGGSVMGVEKDLSGTLRAQTHGNNPVVCIQETASRENPKSGPQGKGWKYDTAFSLDTSPVPQAVCYENHGQDSRIKDCGAVSPTLSAKAETGGGNLPIVMVPKKTEVLGLIDMQGGKGSCRTTDGKLCPTILSAHGDIHAVFVAEEYKECAGFCHNAGAGSLAGSIAFSETTSPTLSAKAGTGGGNLPLVQESPNRPKFWNGNDFAECLTAKGAYDRMPDKGRLPCVIEPDAQSPTVHLGSQVRRLTPRECERLQGFPDDWTQIPWRGKPAEQCPDGLRYKACGNSMAVPVMRWIGERIEKVKRERK
jgi:DNA (cytosine-5)-methyltransferase 1